MRRGAALRLVLLDRPGEWHPVFSCLLLCASALMLPLERMISHVFPWALT